MRGWFGAAVLIAVGVLGLIDNFDLLPRELLQQMWKLWPLIPLAIGISILLRRQISGESHGGPTGR
jgi:cadmium resistance protein CadD (predicted permease)